MNLIRPIIHRWFFVILLAGGFLWSQSGTIRFERLNIEDGLSQTVVNCIVQDRSGFLWFGTQDGLNRYDGYQFKIFKRNSQATEGLHSDGILSMLLDKDGKLWVGTDSGLNWFDEKDQVFRDAVLPGSDPRPTKDYFMEILFQDDSGKIWVSTYNHGLIVFDPHQGLHAKYDHTNEAFSKVVTGRVASIHQAKANEIWVGHLKGVAIFNPVDESWRALEPQGSSNELPDNGRIFSILTDRNGMTWFGGDYGLFHWDPNTENLTQPKDLNGLRLGPGDDTVWQLHEDKEGAIWVGGMDGVFRIDPSHKKQTAFLYDALDPHSMGREVHALYQDNSGVMWAGSYNDGLLKLPASNRHFVQYRHHPNHSNSLSGEAIRTMCVDRDNQLWVGTYEGGLSQYNAHTDDFRRYQSSQDGTGGPPSDTILDISQASDGKMWIGAIGGVGIFDPATQSWETLSNDPTSSPQLPSHLVYSILEDKDQKTWLGSSLGLQVLDTQRREIATYAHDPEAPGSLVQNDVLEIWQDSKSRIWFATFGGVSHLSPGQNTFKNFKNDPQNPNSISHNTALSFCEDHAGQIWIGTSHGLSLYREESDDFQNFGSEELFPNMTIYGVLEDQSHHLWLSTNTGLIRFDPRTKALQTFDVKDGLQSNEFNQGAFAKGQDGRQYFGGINGITAFYPKNIQIDQTPPQLTLTNFLVRNRTVTPQTENGPLDQAIHLTQSITLPYRDYLFSFEFAALNFNNPQKNQYAFKLDGLDENWIQTDAANRRATYTKLEPGEYLFKVKGSNSVGVWNEAGTQIKLRILPPFYRTWWAYTLYFIAVVGLIFAIYAWRVHEVKAELGRERVVNEKLQQLNRLKDDFLANTSHELRTPLNGIIGLAESLRDGVAGDLPKKADHNLSLIVQSGRRLSHLVSDLLDFSSLRTQTIQLNPKPLDLHTLADVTTTLLKPLADQKNLVLHNRISKQFPAVLADEDRLQQILFNLVGNGIKFTDSGSVTLAAETEDDTIKVMVCDTGPGIPPEEQEAIFRSFQRGMAAKTNAVPGTGLGLALTNRLVVLHGGEITVSNNADRGATFQFTLPVAHGQAETNFTQTHEDLVSVMATPTQEWLPSEPTQVNHDDNLDDFRVLIVDDDPVNRQVLLDHLAMQHYHVASAANGKEALALIEESPPFDLILLDIMMPQMSGYEVCRRLRENYPIHELPVIFLTAKNQIADLVSGFDAGANDYLTKPITKLALLRRVQTHIKLLDANRNLESKVAKRTQQLRIKNEELEDLNKVLERLSLTDPMTHLGNRRYLRKYLDKEVALVHRNYKKWVDEQSSGSIEDNDLLFLLFDIDHFKRINDTYGHLAGDEVLIQIKGLMESVSREYDLLVRCGGEEFLIVFRRADRRQASILAERLRKKVAEHAFDLSMGPTVHMTISLGIASFPFRTDLPEAWTWEQVLDIADQALYLAKKNGRNAWAILEATQQTPSKHFINEIRTDMEGLVKSGRLSLKSAIPLEQITRWSKKQPTASNKG